MSLIVRELFAKIGLDVDAQSFAKGALAVEALKFGLGKAIDAAVGLGRAFYENAKAAIEYGDELHDTSQAVAVAASTLQEFRHAAALSGVSVEEMDISLKFLARSMEAASKGSGDQAAAFGKLGVSVRGANGKLRDSGDVMEDLAEKLNALPDGAQKTALAMQLFGRSGNRLIPMLNEGRDGIAAMRKEARDLGLVMSDEAINAADELGDDLTRLSAVSKGLWREAIGPLIPAIGDLVKRFLAWKKANAELIRGRIQQFMSTAIVVVEKLGKALRFTIDMVRAVTKGWKVFAVVLGPLVVGAAINSAITFFGSLTIAAVKAGVAATAAAIGMAAAWALALAPVAALALLVEDMLVYQKDIDEGGTGINTVYGRFLQGAELWKKPFQNLFAWISGKKTLWEAVTDGWKEALDRFADYIEGAWAARVKRLFDSIGVNKARSMFGLQPLGLPAAPGSSIPPITADFTGPPPRAYATPGSSTRNSTQVHAPITVVQRPGEDGRSLAKTVRGEIETLLEEAAASQPPSD